MATKTNIRSHMNRCLLVFGLFCEVYGFLDIDELSSIHYGIDIVREPIVIGQEETSGLNSLQLVSKFGQQYQCSFPDHVQKDKQKEEEEKVAMETGIPELLKGLEEGPCLYKTKEWWSYEFCYGKHIRQYHADDGKITGDIVYLGYYESEFDWNNETNQQIQASVNKRLNTYHSQRYINGTKCDLTQDLRKSEVRFLCEEGAGDYISRIDEPETCSYIITVHTTRICHHPYLKPPIRNKSVPIKCNPLLSQDQYDLYLEEQKEKEKEEFIKRREELKERANKILREKEEKDRRDASDADDESTDSALLNDNEDMANIPAANTKSKIEKIQESVSKHLKELVKEGEEKDRRDASDADDESTDSALLNDNEDMANIPAANTKSKIEKIQESVSKNLKELVKEGEEKDRRDASDADDESTDSALLNDNEDMANIPAANTKSKIEKIQESVSKNLKELVKEGEEKHRRDASDADDESTDSALLNDNEDMANIPAANTKSKIEKIQESVSKHLKELVKEGEDPIDMKLYVSTIDDVDDLEKFINEAIKLSTQEADRKATVTKKDEDSSEGVPDEANNKGMDDVSKEEKEPELDEDDEDDDEDEEIIDEFSDDITKIKERFIDSSVKFSEMKDSIHDTMHNQFDEILNEAERELAEEGVDVDDMDKKAAFDQLAGTLNKLIRRLETTEEEIDKVDKELEEFTQKNGIDVKNKDVSYGSDTDGAGGHTKTDEEAKGPDKQQVADDRLKVRVTKVQYGSDIQGLKDDTNSEQSKEIERSVKEGLEQAGIDTAGGTIQVKIITAGYYDGKDNSMEVLSSEDTAAFKNMIVAILSGDNEAGEEAKRYQQMTDNYNFVFGKNKQKSKEVDES